MAPPPPRGRGHRAGSRGGGYAEGARRGAPQAIQVADRWHLIRNGSEALERLLSRHQAALRQALATPDEAARSPEETTLPAPDQLAAPPPAAARPPTRAQQEQAERRARRQARYEAVLAWHRQGESISGISRRTGLTRMTVRKYLRADGYVEPARRPTQLDEPSPHAAYLRQRWAAGCHNAAELWRELRTRGFAGSAGTVRRYVAGWRAEPGRRGRPPQRRQGPGQPPTARPPAPRTVRRWLLTPAAELEAEQRSYLERLLAACPVVATAQELTGEFIRLVRERDQAALAPWLVTARRSGLVEVRERAAGIERDRAAVENALLYEWSNGQTEAQVLQVKRVRRQMQGRGKLDLLRRRLVKVA